MDAQLVPVFTGQLQDQSVQLCNARDLHAFLEVGRDFTTWIKERIEQYGFADGEDYATVTAPPIRGAGNRGKRTDYHLTLDMAQELGMVENNEQGRQIRRYFIALRKTAQQPIALPAPQTGLSNDLRAHINRKAHEIALRQYDTIHAILTDCATDNIACGATEEKAFGYVDTYGELSDGTVLANIRDLKELVWNSEQVINQAASAIAAIHRIEQRSGYRLHTRLEPQEWDNPDFHKHDRLVQEVIARMTGETD